MNYDVIQIGAEVIHADWNYKQIGSHNMMPDFTPEDDDDETCGKAFEDDTSCEIEDEDEWDNYD